MAQAINKKSGIGGIFTEQDEKVQIISLTFLNEKQRGTIVNKPLLK